MAKKKTKVFHLPSSIQAHAHALTCVHGSHAVSFESGRGSRRRRLKTKSEIVIDVRTKWKHSLIVRSLLFLLLPDATATLFPFGFFFSRSRSHSADYIIRDNHLRVVFCCQLALRFSALPRDSCNVNALNRIFKLVVMLLWAYQRNPWCDIRSRSSNSLFYSIRWREREREWERDRESMTPKLPSVLAKKLHMYWDARTAFTIQQKFFCVVCAATCVRVLFFVFVIIWFRRMVCGRRRVYVRKNPIFRFAMKWNEKENYYVLLNAVCYLCDSTVVCCCCGDNIFAGSLSATARHSFVFSFFFFFSFCIC